METVFIFACLTPGKDIDSIFCWDSIIKLQVTALRHGYSELRKSCFCRIRITAAGNKIPVTVNCPGELGLRFHRKAGRCCITFDRPIASCRRNRCRQHGQQQHHRQVRSPQTPKQFHSIHSLLAVKVLIQNILNIRIGEHTFAANIIEGASVLIDNIHDSQENINIVLCKFIEVGIIGITI